MSCIVEVFEVGEPEEILGEANRDLEGKLAAIGVLLDAHVHRCGARTGAANSVRNEVAVASPVATADVARVVAAVLADPAPHLGRLYGLTGPRSQDMNGIAREFSDALNREITYSESPAEDWERELKRLGLPEHLTRHVVTMGELHRAGRYARLADGVQRVTGRPAMSVREFVSLHADEFGGRRS